MPAARDQRNGHQRTRRDAIKIVLDNAPGLTSQALGQWTYWRRVRLRFIDPGKPVQNAYIESFAPESSA